MKLHRPALAVLALYIGLPALGASDAEAAFIRRTAIKVKTNSNGDTSYRVGTTVSGDAGTVATITAAIESDAGEEELALVETDAWLHGAATIAALPATDVALTVTLYDSGSASLISFSGTLAADGTVTLAADDTTSIENADCASRTGCAEETTRADSPDIEMLAADVFAAAKGYDLSIDLAGADTYEVAYASVTVTEPGGAVCLATDEKGNCLKWETTKEVSTRSEVFWDDIGSVWEAEATAAHEGLMQLKVIASDARGNKLETAKSKLGAPWLDDGEGVNTLATDEDPLTRVALHKGLVGWWAFDDQAAQDQLTIVSEGWASGDELPVDAEVELTNGETITIPVNSYQKRLRFPITINYLAETKNTGFAFKTFNITASGILLPLSPDDLYFGQVRPVCSEGFCATVSVSDGGEYELSMMAYGAAAAALPEEFEVSISVLDEFGDEVAAETALVELDDEITAVFANEVSLVGDPIGVDLSGKVKLLGEANRKGKQETLAKGKFYGTFSRDGDGDLELAGADKDEVVSSGDIIVAGEAVFLTDREGVPVAPPAIQFSNGSGTKNATTTTSTRPQLL
ncbi:MAG: hypothetical protein V4850_01900 [Myxococcota bacterium]